MNQKLLDLLEYINDILFDENININQHFGVIMYISRF